MPELRMSVASLRSQGDALVEELQRELFRVQSGQTRDPDFASIHARYGGVVSEEALAFTLQQYRETPAADPAMDSVRRLLAWQVDLLVDRELSGLDARAASWRARAVCRLPDAGAVPYEDVPIAIGHCHDRRTRLAIDHRRNELLRTGLTSLSAERFQRERELVEGIGIAPGYVATFEALNGISLADLREQCSRLLAATQDLWTATFDEFVAQHGIPPHEARRADAIYLLRGNGFDPHFPGSEIQPSVFAQLAAMGLDPSSGGRIMLDLVDRPGKMSRASYAAVRVPHEVHVVVKPHGGHLDWFHFLHEMGHALHFANTAATLPFEHRRLGDTSVTEGYAMLFDHLMKDGEWLRQVAGLHLRAVSGFLRLSGFVELFLVRRECAKLLWVIELYETRGAWDPLPERFCDTLSSAVTFRYDPAQAFVDVDAGFSGARYLQAWQLQALLRDTLRELFGPHWWKNPQAGSWMVSTLFSRGQSESATELAQRVSRRPLSFAPVVNGIEELLAVQQH